MNIIDGIFNWITKLFQWWVIVMPWEKGIRIRLGKRWTLLSEGIYLKLPIIDRIYVQSTANRVIAGPVQTLTTLDGKTLTISVTIGYCIEDVQKLYQKVFHTELTITNMVLGQVSEFISTKTIYECNPKSIELFISEAIKMSDLGIGNVHAKITGYALVKTYRLISDGHTMYEGFNMNAIGQ